MANKSQITMPKSQTNTKSQIAKSKLFAPIKKFVAWNLKFVWKLLFGIWNLGKKKQQSPLFTLVILISIPLLILLIAVLRKFFDASRMEQLARYFSSREGQVIVRVYVVLIIVALVVTFPKQTRKIINLTIFSFQSIFKLIAKFSKFIAFIAKLGIGKLNNLRRSPLFRARSRTHHKRKTE